jgi:Tfp pilus assembly protein PilV
MVNQKNKHESGFSGIETLLVVLIIAVLGFGGYAVWHSRQSKSSSYQALSTDLTKTATNSTPLQTVSNFYNKYNLNIGNETASQATVQAYGSTDLISYFNKYKNVGEDPIECSQDNVPNFTINLVNQTKSVAKVNVIENFTTPQTIAVTVVNQNGWKVDSVTCPTPLPTSAGTTD